jgi:hypothetical protein
MCLRAFTLTRDAGRETVCKFTIFYACRRLSIDDEETQEVLMDSCVRRYRGRSAFVGDDAGVPRGNKDEQIQQGESYPRECHHKPLLETRSAALPRSLKLAEVAQTADLEQRTKVLDEVLIEMLHKLNFL